MTINGWAQIALYCLVVIAVTKPLGGYMTRVFAGDRTLLTPVLRPIRVLALPRRITSGRDCARAATFSPSPPSAAPHWRTSRTWRTATRRRSGPCSSRRRSLRRTVSTSSSGRRAHEWAGRLRAGRAAGAAARPGRVPPPDGRDAPAARRRSGHGGDLRRPPRPMLALRVRAALPSRAVADQGEGDEDRDRLDAAPARAV